MVVIYLGEVSKFTAFYSTVDRKRGTTRVWLIGNTITKANPYLYEWGLLTKINKMKQGDIIELNVANADGEPIPMAIEYCKASGGKSMAIGYTAQMIDKGNWQANPQPHLPKSIKEYNFIYRIGFLYQGFKFLADFLIDKEDSTKKVFFIYPYFKEFKKDLHIVSDIVNPSPYWHRDLYSIKTKSTRLQKVLEYFTEANIFYSNDLCGTDFKQVIDFNIKR